MFNQKKIGILYFIIAFNIVNYGYSLGNSSPPQISYEKIINLNNIPEHSESIEINTAIGNKGERDLLVSVAKLSCDCIASTRSTITIPPDEIQYLHFRVNVKNKEGGLREFIQLKTNDPEQPQVIIQISGQKNSAVLINPPSINRYAEFNVPVTLKFDLASTSSISNVNISGSSLFQIIKIEPFDDIDSTDKKIYHCRIDLKSTSLSQSINEKLFLDLTLAGTPRKIQIPISLKIQPPLRLSQGYIVIDNDCLHNNPVRLSYFSQANAKIKTIIIDEPLDKIVGVGFHVTNRTIELAFNSLHPINEHMQGSLIINMDVLSVPYTLKVPFFIFKKD